ncbi:MAG: alkylphosphonate utilization protein [Solirubrobacteraceae bacterium]|nr:alkylphosphonate utilization protein [Solirubrobacteraceae bacterium]
MSETAPVCPQCASEYTYELSGMTVCSMCAHEWVAGDAPASDAPDERVIKDSVGNPLADGDTVVIVKDLPVKGYPKPIKRGTKVKGIRLIDGVGDHDLDGKVDGFGAMQLKSSVVKKA